MPKRQYKEPTIAQIEYHNRMAILSARMRHWEWEQMQAEFRMIAIEREKDRQAIIGSLPVTITIIRIG